MGHPGETAMTQLHKHVNGVSKLTKPPLFCCHTCLLAKATKRALTKQELQATLTTHMISACKQCNTTHDDTPYIPSESDQPIQDNKMDNLKTISYGYGICEGNLIHHKRCRWTYQDQS